MVNAPIMSLTNQRRQNLALRHLIKMSSAIDDKNEE